MAHGGHHAEFTHRKRALFVRARCLMKKLHRNEMPRHLHVLALVDIALPATPDELLDAIAIAEQFAGIECARRRFGWCSRARREVGLCVRVGAHRGLRWRGAKARSNSPPR